jgi:preprotein translocase subunit SecE
MTSEWTNMLRNRERTDTDIKKSDRVERSVRPERSEKKAAPSREPARRGSTKSNIGVIRYFQETGDELRKVSWPTREQTVRLSIIVLATTVISAVFLGALDALFRFLSSLLVGTG